MPYLVLPRAFNALLAKRHRATPAPRDANATTPRASSGSGAANLFAGKSRDGVELAAENQRADLAVVLVSPQIPGNTGTIARTCAASRVPLHLVGPLGFTLEDSQLKRAGLDYWCVRSIDRPIDRPIDRSIDTRSPLPVAVAPLRPSRSSSISSRPSQAQRVRARARRLGRVLRVLVRRPRGPRSSGRVQARSVSITLVPIRPRRRGACDSLRTFSPGVRLSPPTPSLLSIPTHLDAFQLHP